MPAPVNASAFFPPSMPNFWNTPAAFLHHPQVNANAAAMYAAAMQNGQNGPPPPQHMGAGSHSHHIPVSSPLPLFSPSVPAFPPLLPHSHMHHNGGPPNQLGPLSMNLNPMSPSAAPSPTFPSTVPTPSPPAGVGPGESADGIGNLIWLSSKAGLIKAENDMGSVSFQLKDFCDQAVSDLTSVLRPGFTLQFWACAAPGSIDGSGSWLATFVRPLPNIKGREPHSIEANLEAPPGVETGPPQLPKDPYILEMEKDAVPMLLGIFKRNAVTYCQLSSFHMQISNCGDEKLYRYVGTSSLKRRQFLEKRTHLFHISQSDTVSLQPPALYTTIVTLASYLLKHGGACLLQELFDHFNGCPEIPLEARDMIGEGKNKFLRFLESHPWVFSVFPSRVFVSVRRQLPQFDYPGYMNENFGDQELGSSYGSSPFSSERPASRGWGTASGVQDPTQSMSQSKALNGGSAFGSNPSLPSLMDNQNPNSSNGIPPTPTHSLPPSTPLWSSGSSVRSPFLDDRPTSSTADTLGFLGGYQSSSGFTHPPPPPGDPVVGGFPGDFGMKRSWNSAATPIIGIGSGPMAVGGRIKRFVDTEIQTESTEAGEGEGKAKRMTSIGVQTTPETCTIACGEGESELKEDEPESDVSVSVYSMSSGSGEDIGGLGGETETGFLTGLPEFFNPMTSDSPFSTALAEGIMKNLNLGN